MKREDRKLIIKGRSVATIMDTLKHRLRQMLHTRVGHFTEVIKETGLSRENISKLHNGVATNPTLETAVRIAEACGYTLQFKKKEESKYKDNRNRKPQRAAKRRKPVK